MIGVDLGGTRLRAGIVSRSGELEARVDRPSPAESQDSLIEAIIETVAEMREPGIEAVGCGAPVRIDARTGIVLGAVNLPLADVALGEILEGACGLPVTVVNDGSAAALAEFRHGAGRGKRDLVLLALGTGVGGGVVLDGALYRGWSEVGHMVIVEDGAPCQGSCAGRGHVESYCSGTAANRAAREALGPGATAQDLVAARHPALAQIGAHLGAAVASLQNLVDPEIVVIGGGFGVAAFDQLLGPVRTVVRREALTPAGERVELAVAELGEGAGLVGAGLAAFEGLD